jgi:hypothetical protein
MAGIPRGEIIGCDSRQLNLGAEDSTRVQAFRQRTSENGRGREEFFLSTKDGGRLPVVISVRAIRGPEGGHFAIATLTNMTNRTRKVTVLVL